MKMILFLILSLPLFAVESAQDLKEDIDAILQCVEANVHVGIKVVSLKNQETLYEKNSEKLFVPASNLKLFTGAAALSILGVDFQFDTRLLLDAAGNLYLKGAGDPSLTRYDLENLVEQLKMYQIKEVKNIIIDNSAFDEISQGPGWMWDEPAEFWNSPMDAITIDHNAVSIWVVPSDPPKTILNPPTQEMVVNNQVLTGEKTDVKAERKLTSGEKCIYVEGTIIPRQNPAELKVPVSSPVQFAGELLSRFLTKAGIVFQGNILQGETPQTAGVVASHCSEPLSQIVLEMMKHSDNLYSDCLFKKMGEIYLGAPGTWQKGSLAVREFLKTEVGLDVSQMVLLDGSGLSRYNLVSPQNFISFLSWTKEQFSFAPEFLSSLPIAGIDGSIKKRLLRAKNKVRAKSGAMTGITGLSGYVKTRDNELLAFSILMNGFMGATQKQKKEIEDKICLRLSQFMRE